MARFSSHIVVVLVLVCTGSPTLRARKWVRKYFNRHSMSETCSPVVVGTADYYASIMNREQKTVTKDSIYTDELGPRNTTTAQEFFSREPTGKREFLPPREQDIGDGCMRFKPCDEQAKFRTHDGSCNNLRFPPWAAAGAAIVHVLPQHFDDGVRKVRTSENGEELPSPRLVQTTMYSTSDKPVLTNYTYFFLLWMQLISHDGARLMEPMETSGPECTCCSSTHGHLPKEKLPSNCLPISIPADDPFYSQFNVTCISFKRSITTDDKKCSISPRRSLTGETGYLDLSPLYGNSDEISSSVRAHSGGKLRVQIGPHGDTLLPNTSPSEHHCPGNKACFFAGDSRTNQHPLLSVILIIWMRFHNVVAEKFSQLNSHWDDTRVYEETRKFTIAVWQHITYNEILPMILGEIASENNLTDSSAEKVMNQYDQTLNGGTIASFTSVVFRAFHTMVPDTVDLCDEQRKIIESFKLGDIFFRPDLLNERQIEHFMWGSTSQPIQEINLKYSAEMDNLLLKGKNEKTGLTMLAIDIQRAREHGIPSYPHFKRCWADETGQHIIKSFGDLENHMPKHDVELLSKMYRDYEDVDALVALMKENKQKGAMFSNTMVQVIVQQFIRWKFGDRMFVKFGNSPGSMTVDQIKEVQKCTAAIMMCMTTKVNSIQPNLFKIPSQHNQIQDCKKMININFPVFKEKIS